ncbi:glycosyltransferase family 4 protein [Candidatus Saccharibacteria bacterium]|nr:glycosyltransferase family 4 protein [Candidatus Saccharibacteria bacterium]
MRIGIVCPYNYFRPGGVQVLIRGIADTLQQRGHYVRIIAPKPRKVPKDVPDDLVLIGTSTEFNTPFATKADLGMSGSNETIDALFEEHKFDILHLHEPGMPVLSAQLLSRSNAVNIGTMHATLPSGAVSKSFVTFMLPYAKYIDPKIDLVTAVSDSAKQSAIVYSPKRKVTIIPNGIDINKYQPKDNKDKNRSMTNKTKTIVYVGRLEKRKGARYLIEAYAELCKHHKDIRLIIIGDGGLRKSLEAQVEKLQAPNVKFLGFVSEKKKIEYLQKADLFVSPALFGESFGIVLVEAMAAGCVTLAGNNSGYQTVMTGRGRLSLVNPKSTDDFWQRMELLIYDQEIRKLWLEWAKNHIKQFDYSIITSMYLDVYKQGLKKRKANK